MPVQPMFICLGIIVLVVDISYRLTFVCVQSNDEDCKLERKLEVVERAVGCGVHRKLIFGCDVSKEQTK